MQKGLGWLALPLSLMLGLAHADPGTVTYVYADALGTPLAEADASGNITATFDYRPYGSQALGSPPSGPGYTGHVNDPDSGFIYMQARYYDPVLQRFLSIDPVAPSASALFGFNRYQYGSGNPILNFDPDGRADCPGQERSVCVRSDAGAARDLRSTPQQDKAALSNWGKVKTDYKPERAVALVGTTEVTVQEVKGEVVQTNTKDGLNLKDLPAGTTAVEHSHIDGKVKDVSSDGFKSPGDAKALGQGIINYAVSERRVAKYEIVGGRIQVTAIQGRFTSPEATALEQSVNAQQPEVDQQRPAGSQ